MTWLKLEIVRESGRGLAYIGYTFLDVRRSEGGRNKILDLGEGYGQRLKGFELDPSC